MKKPKKTILRIEVEERKRYSIICPHCGSYMGGYGLSPNILRIKCWDCKNPIDILQKKGD